MGVIQIQLASPQLKRHARLFAEMVRSLLQALVMVNRIALKSDPRIPPLYSSGVRYIKEKPGVETFRDLYLVLANHGGDCAHLAAWRVAELQQAGENASIRIQWKVTRRGIRLFHVVVRRGNGSIEDPSKLLGMKGAA
jgi:hypothetical protein